MADEEVEVDNDESVICAAEQYKAINIHRRRQIHIIGWSVQVRLLLRRAIGRSRSEVD